MSEQPAPLSKEIPATIHTEAFKGLFSIKWGACTSMLVYMGAVLTARLSIGITAAALVRALPAGTGDGGLLRDRALCAVVLGVDMRPQLGMRSRRKRSHDASRCRRGGRAESVFRRLQPDQLRPSG